MNELIDERIEGLLGRECWVVDMLPERVPQDCGGSYFAVDDYWYESGAREALSEGFFNIVLKLSCYYGLEVFDGEELLPLPVWERARRGLFLSFQTPEEIPGVTVENMLRTARQTVTGKKAGIMAFRKELAAALETLKMDPDWGKRFLNVGFSGGEKKRTEILQLLMLKPKLALLDETDSGLDVDAVRVVSDGIRAFRTGENACLIITHNANILSSLSVDRVHVLLEGRIAESGGPELAEEIGREGYGRFGNG